LNEESLFSFYLLGALFHQALIYLLWLFIFAYSLRLFFVLWMPHPPFLFLFFHRLCFPFIYCFSFHFYSKKAESENILCCRQNRIVSRRVKRTWSLSFVRPLKTFSFLFLDPRRRRSWKQLANNVLIVFDKFVQYHSTSNIVFKSQ
jgi:hypothetical protein